VTEYNDILKFSLDTRPLTRLILTITFIYTTTTGMPSLIQMLCIMLHSPALQCSAQRTTGMKKKTDMDRRHTEKTQSPRQYHKKSSVVEVIHNDKGK